MQASEKFMRLAIKQAEIAKKQGSYAIGAVVVRGEEVLASGENRIKLDHDPTSHAEIVAIRSATKKAGTRYLPGAVLYTTHEPCPMCVTAAIWAKMEGIVYGSAMEDMKDYRLKNGNGNWQWRTIEIKARDLIDKGDPKLFLVEDFMRQECIKLFHS